MFTVSSVNGISPDSASLRYPSPTRRATETRSCTRATRSLHPPEPCITYTALHEIFDKSVQNV